jgi:hypothetical protein
MQFLAVAAILAGQSAQDVRSAHEIDNTMLRSLTIAMTIAICAARYALAIDLPTKPLSLNKQEQKILQNLACVAAPELTEAEIHTWRFAPPHARSRGAFVLCPLPLRAHGLEAFHKRTCARTNTQAWRCDERLSAFRIPIGSQAVLITHKAEQVSIETAIEIAHFIGVGYGYTFNARNLSTMMTTARECHINQAGQAAYKGANNYVLSCGLMGILVTRDCASKPCRLFPSAFQDSASNALSPDHAALQQ